MMEAENVHGLAGGESMRDPAQMFRAPVSRLVTVTAVLCKRQHSFEEFSNLISMAEFQLAVNSKALK